jgi:O-antigen chain-terminating methyltransferase
MLESKNPEIDVRELMAKVQAEVQRRRVAGGMAPVPQPSLFGSLESQVADAIHQARQKHEVDARFPKHVQRLFRDQGGVNAELIRAVDLLAKQLVALQAAQQKAERKMLSQWEAGQSEIAALKGEILQQRQTSQNEIAVLKGEASMQRLALTRLLDELRARQGGETGAAVAEKVAGIQQHGLDAFYFAFENRYRGSREEIRKRLRVYLPYVTQAGVGTVEKPILDLGCGRGEWLELLKENGCTARGVDMNVSALAACRKLGLGVVEADIMTFLRSLPDRSQGMVTGFHIIEHLPLPMVLELMTELHRVLQEGGLVVLESPNPANIQVGACNFYLDPTHLRPLPSGLTVFLVEYAGFTDIRALYLQPVETSSHVGPPDSPVAQRFNEYFFGPQDYAVIGSKPMARGGAPVQAGV